MDQLVEQVVASIIATVREQLQSSLANTIACGFEDGLEPKEIAEKSLAEAVFKPKALAPSRASTPVGGGAKTPSKSVSKGKDFLRDANNNTIQCQAIKGDKTQCANNSKDTFNGGYYCLLHMRSVTKEKVPTGGKRPTASKGKTQPSQSSVTDVLSGMEDIDDIDL